MELVFPPTDDLIKVIASAIDQMQQIITTSTVTVPKEEADAVPFIEML
jgi:hypothetical protein